MRLNADFTARVAVHAAEMPWIASPTSGVERRMLDRIGDEVARATSIVRYALESRFPAHTHGGGEEFFVLDGVFQDEHGDYPAGTYVRNPPTTRHVPGSAPGCTIFVKLWQFDPDDRQQMAIDTRTGSWQADADRPSVDTMALFESPREWVRLERWAPGAEIAIESPMLLEVLVLDGTFDEAGETFARQSWLRLPAGIATSARAGPNGATLWLKGLDQDDLRTGNENAA